MSSSNHLGGTTRGTWTPELLRGSMLLYAVTDRAWLQAGETLEDKVYDSIRGGATFMQLREKHLSTEEIVELGARLQAICEKEGVPFVINDDVEAALALDCDGVHVGQSDMGCLEARALLGEGKIVGVSCQTVEQALRAQDQGADYLGVGTVFPTGTKPDAEFVPFERLRDICAAVSIPVVAIGGISKDKVGRLAGSGIDGVAVVSALFAAQDSRKAAKELSCLTKEMLAR